jgi:AbrB family looped-hinge helix DNA binding protein
MKATIDAAGRIVIPKPIREHAGLGPNAEVQISLSGTTIELRPVSVSVRLESRGSFVVATPTEETPGLSQQDVDAAIESQRLRLQ